MLGGESQVAFHPRSEVAPTQVLEPEAMWNWGGMTREVVRWFRCHPAGMEVRREWKMVEIGIYAPRQLRLNNWNTGRRNGMVQRTCVSHSLCYRTFLLNRGRNSRIDIFPTRVPMPIQNPFLFPVRVVIFSLVSLKQPAFTATRDAIVCIL